MMLLLAIGQAGKTQAGSGLMFILLAILGWGCDTTIAPVAKSQFRVQTLDESTPLPWRAVPVASA
jgi:hypothetical protein